MLHDGFPVASAASFAHFAMMAGQTAVPPRERSDICFTTLRIRASSGAYRVPRHSCIPRRRSRAKMAMSALSDFTACRESDMNTAWLVRIAVVSVLASWGVIGPSSAEEPARIEPRRQLAGHASRITAIAFSPDGATLAVGCGDIH